MNTAFHFIIFQFPVSLTNDIKIVQPYVRILVLRTPFVRIPSDVEYVLCRIHKHDNIANGTCYVILQSRILSDTRRNIIRDK